MIPTQDICPICEDRLLDAFGQCAVCDNQNDDPDMVFYLHQISQADSKIETLLSEVKRLRENRARMETKVLAQAAAQESGAEGFGLRVRWTPGRAVGAWDVEQVMATLPEELKAAVVSYMPSISTTVLNSLEKAGKLPEAVLEAKSVIPAPGRYILEKIRA